jgi:hypothetical protein
MRRLRKVWRDDIVGGLEYLSSEHPVWLALIIFFLASLTVIDVTVGLYGVEVYDKTFLLGVLGNLHGSLFDLLLVGALVLWFNKLGERRQAIKRYQEEIEDYLLWYSDEAAHRIAGNIRRLNRLGITNIYLAYAYLNKADLVGVNLMNACLMSAELQETILITAHLQGASLVRANLKRALLAGANLTSADLWYADLSGANLARANLMEANLEDADLTGVLYSKTTRWPAGYTPPSSSILLNVDDNLEQAE